MLEFYAQVRSAHIGFVVASGLLFAVRGVAVLAGRDWPLAMPVRILGHAIDTALLTAGIMLVVMLPAEVFANGWLAIKLLLLAGYVAAGFVALRRARTRPSRVVWLAVAMLLFVSIFGIARAHHPLGWLAPGG
jgi:uncharacterized membrane protein SirB2